MSDKGDGTPTDKEPLFQLTNSANPVTDAPQTDDEKKAGEPEVEEVNNNTEI
jgi:hypothetical protein